MPLPDDQERNPDWADEPELGPPPIPDPEPLTIGDVTGGEATPDEQLDPFEGLSETTEQMRQADEPDRGQQTLDRFREIQQADQMVGGEKPRPGYPRANARRAAERANQEQAKFLEREGVAQPPQRPDGLPQNFGDFLRDIEQMRKAAGHDGPLPGAALRSLQKRYEQLQRDHGMEVPAGQEDLEVDQREKEAVFRQTDKQLKTVQLDLLRNLTRLAIEQMRELTRLNDSLLRNRQ